MKIAKDKQPLSVRERAVRQTRISWLLYSDITLPDAVNAWPDDAARDLDWCEREIEKESEAAKRERKGLK